MQSHVLCGSQIHDSFANAPWMRSVLHLKKKITLLLCIFGIFPLFVLYFVAKLYIVAWLPHWKHLHLLWMWIVCFALMQYYCHIFALVLLLFVFWHLAYQTCHYVLHQRLLQWRCLQGDNQIWGQQILKQSHDDVFLPHGYLQTCKLILKHFDLIDMVQ